MTPCCFEGVYFCCSYYTVLLFGLSYCSFYVLVVLKFCRTRNY